MQLIAVTDIFGITEHFENLLNDIKRFYTSVEIIDPYDRKEIDFKNEDEAYGYFQEKMGLKNYSDILNKTLQGRENKEQILLGFSVGASAVWAISEKLELHTKTKGICFYSSQVRNFLHVNPKIKIDFYFSH